MAWTMAGLGTGRAGVGLAAVAQPQAQHAFGELVGERAGVDDRHRQVLGHVAVGLVQMVVEPSRIASAPSSSMQRVAHSTSLGKDHLLLAAQQVFSTSGITR